MPAVSRYAAGVSHPARYALFHDGPFMGKRVPIRPGQMEWLGTERFDVDQGHSIVTTRYRYQGPSGDDPETVVFEYVTQGRDTSVDQ